MGFVLWFLAVIFVEFIIMGLTNNIVVAGVIIITFGLLFLVCKRKGLAMDVGALVAATIYCFVWGGLICVSPLMYKYTPWGVRYTTFVWAGGFGFMFLSFGIYEGIGKFRKCTERIEATYVGAAVHRGRRSVQYSPQFAYRRNGKDYQNTTGVTYSKRKLNRKFQLGKIYQIWIEPTNPYKICFERKLEGSPALMVGLGIGCLLVGIFGDF